MNRKELRDYIFDFWWNWGAFNYDERDDDEIKLEIYENLGTINGINKELNFLKYEFDAGWDKNSLEYKRLTELKNYIEYYKERGDLK